MSRWPSQINQLDQRYHPLLHHETIAAHQSEIEEAIKVQALVATATATSAAPAGQEAIAKEITAAPAVIVRAIIAVLLPTV
jgi:hypothetical protein